MSSATVTFELPEGIAEAEARETLAAGLFAEGKVSLGRGAALAGLPKDAFMKALGRRGIAVFDTPPEELEGELESLIRHFG